MDDQRSKAKGKAKARIDVPKAVEEIPAQLDAAVKMHSEQAKKLRKAGIGVK